MGHICAASEQALQGDCGSGDSISLGQEPNISPPTLRASPLVSSDSGHGHLHHAVDTAKYLIFSTKTIYMKNWLRKIRFI